MSEKIKPELLTFLQAGEMPLRLLVVEGADYLSDLRRMMPQAEIFAVFADADERENPLYDELRVTVFSVDTENEPLPFPQNFFDYIISDLTLERAANPQDIAAGFGTFLKPTGAWLTSFRNIRHWSVLADIMDGHYYNVVSRLYAKQEFERLLYASFYKEVRMRPQIREAEDDTVAKLTAAGFSNLCNDLNTEFWLVRAARSMPELALLKSMYDEATREKLSRTLHRIEYGVETKASCAAFWRLYADAEMFADYAAAFIEQAVFHHARFYENMLAFADEKNSAELQNIIAAALRESIGEEKQTLLRALLAECENKDRKQKIQ